MNAPQAPGKLGPDTLESAQPVPGELLPKSLQADPKALVQDYHALHPDPADPRQRVAFGTSGHRGSSSRRSFNEDHILATTQAICDHRAAKGLKGPLFLGGDSHALSRPATESALRVLAANGVTVILEEKATYSPTPVISHAIRAYNRAHPDAPADGIIVTPSHNPPTDGGFKYDEPHGGPADTDATGDIQDRANAYLEKKLQGVKAVARFTPDLFRSHDRVGDYVRDLPSVVDVEAIRRSGVRVGIDPLGGASVETWKRVLADHQLTAFVILDDSFDPAFRRIPADHDGKVRMDPSSPFAMRAVMKRKDEFPLIGGNDTDADRFGIVTAEGLLNPNHFLATAVSYLTGHRPGWGPGAGIGKTLVSSAMVDRVTNAVGRKLVEVPVGFKWFVPGLASGTLAFVGEESAGLSCLRRDGTPWTTEKDGILAVLLAAEMLAVTGKTPAQLYQSLTERFGAPVYRRVDVPATPDAKRALAQLSPSAITVKTLAGDPIQQILTRAPGNDAPIGGLKLVTEHGWVAVRPSGTEDINKTYAESFLSDAHLTRLLDETRTLLERALGGGSPEGSPEAAGGASGGSR